MTIDYDRWLERMQYSYHAPEERVRKYLAIKCTFCKMKLDEHVLVEKTGQVRCLFSPTFFDFVDLPLSAVQANNLAMCCLRFKAENFTKHAGDR